MTGRRAWGVLRASSLWAGLCAMAGHLSVRSKIFCGCICLTFVTIIVGGLSQAAQSRLSETAFGIYDNAFISMSYLRSAQALVLGVSRDLALGHQKDVVYVDQLQSALDALDLARERAMSPRGEDYARELQVAVAALQGKISNSTKPPQRQDFKTVEQIFDLAVDVYAGDGFRLRRSVEALVWRTQIETYGAIAGSIAIAFAITLLLSRAIVPSIRHAVAIASSIAEGRLDNQIDPRGTSETGVLLKALATMQGSIADKIAFIETLMARQVSSHAAEIAIQHARFEAALNNMTLGLCMFDAEGRLLVHNRRFVEMFELEGAGGDIEAVLPHLGLDGPGRPPEGAGLSRAFQCELEDGRMVAVTEEAMDGGGHVTIYEDVTERHRADARLSHMARHDALTGLPNRLLFREKLEAGIARVGRDRVLSLLCLDLDHFKSVNDTLGHPIGDALLREAALRLQQTADTADMVVRLGGDEFAVVQESAALFTDASQLARRLIDVLSSPFEIEGHNITVGASIGIVETSEALDTPDQLLKHADMALYLAKGEGRGTYRFFESEMDARIQAKRLLELDLRKAIAEEQLELYYQPLLNTQTGAIVAFEALLRWHHPTRGMVSPADFVPLAEETGLIVGIGRWVLNQACREAAGWPGGVKVAINLSPLQFHGQALFGEIAAALEASGLPAARLELEITESLMLKDTPTTLGVLHELRSLGICISMDDFGTGYSSLSYLRRFPFNKIKIDQSFIRNMTEGDDGLAIVKAVIELGRSLRMGIVAEGVETLQQLELLQAAGCAEVQGYLFSRPQPGAIILALAQRSAPDEPKELRRLYT